MPRPNAEPEDTTMKTPEDTNHMAAIREYLAESGCDVSGPHGSRAELVRAAEDRLAAGEDAPADLTYLARLLARAQEVRTQEDTTMTTETTPSWREHDGVTPWQVCRDCGLTTGEGITTKYDAAYNAEDHDPAACPRCGGRMGLDDRAERKP